MITLKQYIENAENSPFMDFYKPIEADYSDFNTETGKERE